MADTKVTAFTAVTPAAADIIPIVDDVAGTAVLRKVLVSDVNRNFIRTAAEVSAGVTPTDFTYEPGNVKRYGAVGDGTTDDTVAIQTALTIG